MLSVVKKVSALYDAITFPLYYLSQRPWTVMKEARKVRSRPSSGTDPWSAWIRDEAPKVCLANQFATSDAYFKKVMDIYSTRPCLGHRQVLKEEDAFVEGKPMVKKLLSANYTWYTYEEVNQRVDNIMKGFQNLGVQPKDHVIIFMETRIEWMLTFLALNRLGVVVSTLFNTLGNEGIVYSANLVESPVLVTSFPLARKMKTFAANLKHISHVVCVEDMKGQLESGSLDLGKQVSLISFDKLEESGRRMSEDTVKENLHKPKPEDDVLVVFTSGSSGVPKGVVIDHKALMASQGSLYCGLFPGYNENDVYIAFLPLAHILELNGELCAFSNGLRIGYSSPFTLLDNSPGLLPGSKGDAPLLRPTFMAAVPLMLDRIKKTATDKLSEKSQRFNDLFDFAVQYKEKWYQRGHSTPLLNATLFKKAKNLFGGRLKYIYCGGAPLSPESQIFVESALDAKVVTAYGATETLGPVIGNHFSDLSRGRVGNPIDHVKLKLIPWEEGGYYPSDKPYPRGEVVIGGHLIAKGYFKNPEATKAAFFQEDGLRWFKTGDIGEIDSDGSLHIIDRANDLIKLSNGEFVSLGKIETVLKDNEFVENICIYGDSTKSYLIALVSPNLNKLKAIGNRSEESKSVQVKTIFEIPEVGNVVLDSIKETAKRGQLTEKETPLKIVLCPDEWSPATGLLSAALKIRRKVLYKHYESEIKKLYS